MTLVSPLPEPDYIVIRASLDLPEGWLPTGMDGRWYDRNNVPVRLTQPPAGPTPGTAGAVPTGRFEVREDGAVAEVWEVRPWVERQP